MWIDTHAHLYSFSASDLQQIISRAREAHVNTILNTAVNLDAADIVIEQASRHEELFAAAGISPFDVIGLDAEWERRLHRLCVHDRIRAVGEIGLDNSNPRYPPLDLQRPVFETQLRLARELNLPAVIHSRGAESECIETCKRLGVSKAVFHCFTGSTQQLSRLLDSGYYVSLSGIITFSKKNLSHLTAIVPLERTFIETDTPYLAPAPYRGKPNEPAYAAYTGRRLAEIKNITNESLQETLSANYAHLFGWGRGNE